MDLLLEEEGWDVLATSRTTLEEKGPLFLPFLRHGADRTRFVRADLNRDLPLLLEALDEFRPTHVVNFAAQSEVAPSWENPDQWFETNAVALARLVQSLSERPWLERYLHISSPEVYGSCAGRVTEEAPLHPSTPYAASKAAADLLLSAYAKSRNFPVVTVRATNVYGAGQQLFKIIPRTVLRLKKNLRVPLHGGGVAVKSYLHVRDVSRGERAVLERGRNGATYHLSPDEGVSVRDVVARICSLLGRDFAESIEVVAERLGQDAAYVIDSTRARSELGWGPRISLDDGLRDVVRWVSENWSALQKEETEYVHRP